MTQTRIRPYLCAVAVCAAAVVLGCGPKAVRSEPNISENIAPQPTPVNNEPIKIAAVGDVMLGSPFPNDSRMPPNYGAGLLNDVTPILSAADVAFGNLEGPIIDDGV